MDIHSSNITKTADGFEVEVVYKATPRAAEAVARIVVTEDDTTRYYHVADLGRKVRASKAEQERVNELVGVAMRLVHRTARQ